MTYWDEEWDWHMWDLQIKWHTVYWDPILPLGSFVSSSWDPRVPLSSTVRRGGDTVSGRRQKCLLAYCLARHLCLEQWRLGSYQMTRKVFSIFTFIAPSHFQRCASWACGSDLGRGSKGNFQLRVRMQLCMGHQTGIQIEGEAYASQKEADAPQPAAI